MHQATDQPFHGGRDPAGKGRETAEKVAVKPAGETHGRSEQRSADNAGQDGTDSPSVGEGIMNRNVVLLLWALAAAFGALGFLVIQGNVAALCARLTGVIDGLGMTREVIFIDDGSTDRSLALLHDIARTDPAIRILSFSRNFGHQAAISAGLDHASGRAVVIMDGDLQHPPEVLPALIEKWREGYDVVYTVYGTGDLVVEASLDPGDTKLPDLPRFGMQAKLVPGHESLAWYGPGPEETLMPTSRMSRPPISALSSSSRCIR